MDNIIFIVLFGIACTAAIAFLKKYSPEYVLPAALCAGVMILLYVLGDVLDIKERIEVLFAASLEKEYLRSIGKITAVCFIGQWGSRLCVDAGENSLAEKMETAVKITVTGLSLPYIEKLFQIVTMIE